MSETRIVDGAAEQDACSGESVLQALLDDSNPLWNKARRSEEAVITRYIKSHKLERLLVGKSESGARISALHMDYSRQEFKDVSLGG